MSARIHETSTMHPMFCETLGPPILEFKVPWTLRSSMNSYFTTYKTSFLSGADFSLS